jgi:hypothetical protein
MYGIDNLRFTELLVIAEIKKKNSKIKQLCLTHLQK